MLTHTLKRCFLFTVLWLPVSAGLTQASTIVIFNNLGTPPSYDPQNGWTVDGGVEGGQILAVAFTPTTEVSFVDAELPLGMIYSDLTPSPVDVYLAASSGGGAPGTELADLSLAPGQTIGGWPPGDLVTYDCTKCPTLNAGTQYWLVVQIPVEVPENYTSIAAWNWNTTLDYSSGTDFAYNDTQYSTGWQYGPTSELLPAFDVSGSTVPEPGPLALVAAGMAWLGLGIFLRRRGVAQEKRRGRNVTASLGVLICVTYLLSASSRMFGQERAFASVNYEQVALDKWYAANQTGGAFAMKSGPDQVAFDGANIWVTNNLSNNVVKISAVDGSNLGYLNTGEAPLGIAYDGVNIWIANSGDETVTELNNATGETVGTYHVGMVPTGVAFDGTNIWVTIFQGDTVAKLSAATGAILATFTVGYGPIGIACDGVNMWVANSDDNTVTKLRPSGATLGTFSVGDYPEAIAFDGANMWVTNDGSATVTKLRVSDGAVLGTFPVGGAPQGVAFDGANIWVTNALDNTVTELRAADGANLGTFNVGSGPMGIAFDGAHMWVANFESDSLNKL